MLKRTHILFIALCALCVNQALPAQIFFGDVDQDFPLYDSSDPFGIITATNAIALSRSATNTANSAHALGVTATNDAANAVAIGVTATNDAATAIAFGVSATNIAANAVSVSTLATNTAQTAVDLAAVATNQSALATEAAQSVTNTAASALALSASATNTAATALALGVTATNLSSTANTISVTATNRSAMALTLSIIATNTATQASALADTSYLYATNAAAQVATVWPASTNATAVSASAMTRANLAYALAASVNALATNALDVATNSALQVATAYPAATNALGIATNAFIASTNASAQVATAYPVATNASAVSSAAYIAATNALAQAVALGLSKADVTALADYATWAEFTVFSAAALDAVNIAEAAQAATEAGIAATNALANLRITRLWDAADTNVFVEVEGGTNVVVRRIGVYGGWRLEVPVALTNAGVEVLAPTNIALPDLAYPMPANSACGKVFAYNTESFELWYLRFGVWDYEFRYRWRLYIHTGDTPPSLSASEYVIEPYDAEGSINNVYLRYIPPTNELFRIDFAVLTNLAARLAAVEASAAAASNMAAVLETNTVTRTEAAGWETGSHAGLATTGDVAQAIAAIPASDAFVVRDSTDTNRWWRFEGTQAVQYALGAAVTNYTVTLSADFLETVMHTRPEWTNNVFPFSDGVWTGFFIEDTPIITGYAPGGAEWIGHDQTYPKTLTPTELTTAIGTATVYQHVYYPTNATGNVLGPVPTNLVTDASLAAWWVETGAGKLDAQEFEAHVTPALTPDPHPVYLLRTYTNAIPVAGNTVLALDGTNLTVTGATYAYSATVTNAYQLSIPTNAPGWHYSLTIFGTNECTLSDNLLLRGTKTHTGTNCVAFKPETAGTWSVLWGGK